jgi:Fe-S-cluster containining protein
MRFECNRCGLCCGDTQEKTRHILLLQKEAKQIAEHVRMQTADFSLEINNDKLPYGCEMKKTSDGQCVFLKENQCTIYSLRPLICRFYPFQLTFDKAKNLHIFDFTFECPQINQGKIMSQKDFENLFKWAQKHLT